MRALILAAAMLAAGRATAADLPLFRPAGNLDPLRGASLPFETGQVTELAAGRWSVAVSTGYFNLWSETWRTSSVHKELGRVGRPLESDELRLLEQRYPDDAFQFLDLEGWRSDLFVGCGLAGGAGLSVQVPWMDIGRPGGDAIAERWHRALGLPRAHREVFPRGATLAYVKGGSRVIERRDLDQGGLGDITVALTIPAGRALGARHRAVVAIEAPTGSRRGLLGSGGWDAGLRWYADWRLGRVDLLTGAGYTWTSAHGGLLGAERSRPWHLLVGFDWRALGDLTLFIRAYFERSLLAGAGGRVGEAALSERFGVAVPAGRGWLALETGQDSFDNGVAPDFTFHLTAGWGF